MQYTCDGGQVEQELSARNRLDLCPKEPFPHQNIQSFTSLNFNLIYYVKHIEYHNVH